MGLFPEKIWYPKKVNGYVLALTPGLSCSSLCVRACAL